MVIRALLTSLCFVLVSCSDDPPPAPIAPGVNGPAANPAQNTGSPLPGASQVAPAGGVLSCNGVMSMCVECDVGAPCAARVREESCVAQGGTFSNNPCPRQGATGVCASAEQGNRAVLFPPNWGPANSAPWCQNGFRGVWTPSP